MATKKDETAEKKTMSPSEYFDLLKGKREKATRETLQNLYDNACALMNKYKITGQRTGAEKLYKFAEVCEKELKAVDAGIDTYVNRKDIDEYIQKIASKQVVIIELENYERDIPDELVEKIADLQEKKIFDAFYVVFTDYTGGERKKVEQARREKDPILFGAMMIGEQVNTRLYYIGDWVDEYCDLTLDKMVTEFSKKNKPSPVVPITKQYSSLGAFKRSFDESKK